MTKIMTSIIAFDLLKKEEISLEDKFIISENAWRLSSAGYSSMFIMVNDEVTVEDLLLGAISKGNPALPIGLLSRANFLCSLKNFISSIVGHPGPSIL